MIATITTPTIVTVTTLVVETESNNVPQVVIFKLVHNQPKVVTITTFFFTV